LFGGGGAVNVAATAFAAFMVTAHDPMPAHPPPDQPAKELLVSGVAVRVTVVPLVYVVEQVDPQLIPDGKLETVPVPVPDFEMTKL
jgi:hypothetical protein